MKLLTLNQHKMEKSRKYGFVSAVLQLQPHYKDRKTGRNTCPWAGECKKYCLADCGRNATDKAKAARVRRTKSWFKDQQAFLADLDSDLYALERLAKRESLKPTARLNGLSDIAFHKTGIMQDHKDIVFVDYTKDPKGYIDLPINYYRCYSINEQTLKGTVQNWFDAGYNCSKVYLNDLPKADFIDGFWWKVFDGDQNDLRHMDPDNCIVGLRYKVSRPGKDGNRKARIPKISGFVAINQ